MSISFPQTIAAGFLYSILSFASWASPQVSNSALSYALSPIAEGRQNELRIVARKVPLKIALDAIAKKTEVPIHYSHVADEPITVTCTEENLKQILECLVNHKADLALRYSHNPTTGRKENKIAEVWIVGQITGSIAASNVKTAENISDKGSIDFSFSQQEMGDSNNRVAKLLQMAKSDDPEERAAAIGAFLAEDSADNMDIKYTLEQALNDPDPAVRSQAVSTYSHREGSAAVTEALQTALEDNSPAVRLMAVDSITNDVALLQLAVNDSNVEVRNLAYLKLKNITQ